MKPIRRTTRNRRWRAVAPGLLATFTVAALAACKREPAPGTDGVQTYTVRGQIIQLPDPSRPATELQIRHEAIPTFVDSSGKATGMKQMIMPFPTASGVDLTGLAPDDKVEFVFEVRWSGDPLYQVTRITPLPAGTVLDWEAAAPAENVRPDAER